MQNPFVDFSISHDPQPSPVDLDNDGDLDLVVGGDGQLSYLENLGNGIYRDLTNTGDNVLPVLSFLDMSVSFCDLDGDGDYDMSIVGNEDTNKHFYWNTGNDRKAVFTKAGTAGTGPNPISGFDLSELDGGFSVGYADASIFWLDLDKDNDYDAVIGGKLGWFLYYENTGTHLSPQLEKRINAQNPFDGLRAEGEDEGSGVQYESAPYFVDWDSDGDHDLLTSNQLGGIQYYENTGSFFQPVFVERKGSANPLGNVVLAEDAHIFLADLDCDGDWDLVNGISAEGKGSIEICDLEDASDYSFSTELLILPTYEVCENMPMIDLANGNFLRGDFSGAGVNGNLFFPEYAGIGRHQISYTETNSNGCGIYSSAWIEVHAVPVVSLELNRNEFCQNQEPIELSGGLPAGGQYSGPGVSNGVFLPEVAGEGIHTIRYVFTDNDNCESIATDEITVLGNGNHSCGLVPFLELSAVGLNPICNTANGNPSGYIDLSISGGVAPYVIEWMTTNGSGLVTQAEDQSGLTQGSYQAIVTDANGNTGEVSVTLVAPARMDILASATNSSCSVLSGVPDGSINVEVSGGTAPYTYEWNSNAAFPSSSASEDLYGLEAGTYTLVVTDANGCTLSQSYTLTEPEPIDLSGIVTSLDCHAFSGAPSGAIELSVSGGQGNLESDYSYTWTTPDGSGLKLGKADQTELTAGTYTVIVTDRNGCTQLETWTLGEPEAVALIASVPQLLCADGTTTVALEVSGGIGPFLYSSDNGVMMQSDNVFEVGAGVSTFLVEDVNGCAATAEINIRAPRPLELTGAITMDCNTASGMINIIASGGEGEYQYSWSSSTGGTGLVTDAADQSGLSAGTYEVIVSDANGCTRENSFTLRDFETSVTVVDDHCQLGAGAILINIESEGTGDFVTTWASPTGGLLDQTEVITQGADEDIVFTGAQGGETYIFTTVDANGCEHGHTISIEGTINGNPFDFQVAVEIQKADCNTANGDLTIFFDDNPGADQIQFSLDGGLTWGAFVSDNVGSITYTSLAAGTYDLFVRNGSPGCVLDLADVVINNIDVSLELPISATCSNDASFALQGGQPAGGVYSGLGVMNNEFDPGLTGAGTQVINYRYTDAEGCIGFAQDEIEVYLAEDVITEDLVICEDGFPITLGDLIIDGPGTYETLIATNEGCSYKAVYNILAGAITMDTTTRIEISEAELPYIWNGWEYYESGYYVESKINSDGCPFEEILELIVTGTSSTTAPTSLVSIYPNPAYEVMYIVADTEMKLTITNKLGQLTSETKVIPGKNSLDVSNWNTGIHFLHFSNANTRWTEKIVVTR